MTKISNSIQVNSGTFLDDWSHFQGLQCLKLPSLIQRLWRMSGNHANNRNCKVQNARILSAKTIYVSAMNCESDHGWTYICNNYTNINIINSNIIVLLCITITVNVCIYQATSIYCCKTVLQTEVDDQCNKLVVDRCKLYWQLSWLMMAQLIMLNVQLCRAKSRIRFDDRCIMHGKIF